MKALQFVIDNWKVISPVVLLLYSEILSLDPKLKSNGIIQLVGNLLKGRQL